MQRGNKMNKIHQKVIRSILMFKMSTIHRNTYTQTTTPLLNGCRNDGVFQQPSFPQQTFLQLVYIMDLRMVDPLLKDTPDAIDCPPDLNRANWVATSLGMNSLCSKVKCLSSSVNGMISLTSSLRHQVRDIRDM